MAETCGTCKYYTPTPDPETGDGFTCRGLGKNASPEDTSCVHYRPGIVFYQKADGTIVGIEDPNILHAKDSDGESYVLLNDTQAGCAWPLTAVEADPD